MLILSNYHQQMLPLINTFFHEPIYDNLKKNILKEFERYARLHYLYTNKFMITTSWATRSKPKDVSYYHSHNNCMFSGVYYPEVRKGEKLFLDIKMQ